LRLSLQDETAHHKTPSASGVEVAIDARPAPSVNSGQALSLSNGAIQEAIVRALDDRHLNLRAIRQVVEAVIKDALSEMTIVVAAAGETPAEDDWLDGLDEMIID